MTTTASGQSPSYPLFRFYTLEDLAEQTGYSEVYLLDIKRGKQKARKRFRKVCVAILKRSSEELFGEGED